MDYRTNTSLKTFYLVSGFPRLICRFSRNLTKDFCKTDIFLEEIRRYRNC
jgi:hypothetical protein